ncbi:hypothetical protein UFOVP1193_27 [uncultured Caudovirales phage]|uniref:Uncharacterized protein n=1 Tax=uncultured Caudovirales phage TaxID=2100421 RepID=A0A6J5R205_9CAUD|nr:hypothetical protein UFOVP1193_27 [uncultured Caudovirales phage]
MRTVIKLLVYALLLVGFTAALGLHKDTPYVPWALDLHHLSATFAFMCAAGCGVMLVKYF